MDLLGTKDLMKRVETEVIPKVEGLISDGRSLISELRALVADIKQDGLRVGIGPKSEDE